MRFPTLTRLPLLLLGVVLAGCASKLPIAGLQELGAKRIALARPPAMDTGVYLQIELTYWDSQVPINGVQGEFGAYVARHYPADVAYREYCQQLKTELAQRGYVVLDYTSAPATTGLTDPVFGMVPFPLVDPNKVDVILVPSVRFGYHATSRLSMLRLEAGGPALLIDARTLKLVGVKGDSFASIKTDDAAVRSYLTRKALMEDIGPAMDALRSKAIDAAKVTADSIK